MDSILYWLVTRKPFHKALVAVSFPLAVSCFCCCGVTSIDTAARSVGLLPSYTPTPTSAPEPTDTPRPTFTPPPTSTWSPSPTLTLTSVPTHTPAPPTDTPVPTSTAYPTYTATSLPPTDTPRPPTPTETAIPPTATHAPVPEPDATPSPEAVVEPAGMAEVQVVEVIDGDTIRVLINGVEYPVRYIGIDTPETVHPDEPVEWMGPEAWAKNRELVEGKVVTLEKDVSETDKYGRLLRYVWVGDLMVNAELVRLGYAQSSTYPPDVKHQDLLLQLQQEAREAGLGLWGAPPATVPPTEPPPAGNCDPCYPDVCIPPPPPDLDCGEIPFRRFSVPGCDPHRFDGDNDGIGCER